MSAVGFTSKETGRITHARIKYKQLSSQSRMANLGKYRDFKWNQCTKACICLLIVVYYVYEIVTWVCVCVRQTL